MHKLFTKGFRNQPQKQTEIGPVSESWVVVELGWLAMFGNGSTPNRANHAYWDDRTITRQGKPLGNSTITWVEICINQHLVYARFHSMKILPDFVLWYMQTHYDYPRFIASGSRSTKGALTCGHLKTHSIPIPKQDEQTEIVAVFSQLEFKDQVDLNLQ